MGNSHSSEVSGASTTFSYLTSGFPDTSTTTSSATPTWTFTSTLAAATALPNATTLRDNSTCVQLQALINRTQYQSEYWDQCGTSSYLQRWNETFHDDGDGTIYEEKLAENWGVSGRTKCDIESGVGCTSLICNDLADRKFEPQSCAAYQIMNSMGNMNAMLHTVYESLDSAITWFAANQAEISKVLNPVWQSTISTVALRIGVIGIMIGFDILDIAMAAAAATAAALEPWALAATGFALLLTAILMSLNSWLATNLHPPDTDQIATLAALEAPLADYLDQMKHGLQDAADSFYTTGSYNGVSIESIFKNGAMADASHIPWLNPQIFPAEERDALMQNVTRAKAVNFAWHLQRVWLMSFPMNQSDFEARAVVKRDNGNSIDSSQPPSFWLDGYGYFFQSVVDDNTQDEGYHNPYNQKVPGWENVVGNDPTGENQWGIPIGDIVESSVRSFEAGGFNYTGQFHNTFTNPLNSSSFSKRVAEDPVPGPGGPGPSLNDFLELTPRTLEEIKANIYKKQGMFTLPICRMEPSDYGYEFDAATNTWKPGFAHDWSEQGTGSLQDFMGSLGHPDAFCASGETEQSKVIAPFCFCLDKVDKFGVKFGDIYPSLENWRQPPHGWCGTTWYLPVRRCAKTDI